MDERTEPHAEPYIDERTEQHAEPCTDVRTEACAAGRSQSSAASGNHAGAALRSNESLRISVTPPDGRAPWSAPPDFQLPPPGAVTDARIALTLDLDLLDDLRRAIAFLRGMYGESLPAWWCLDCLLLHVRVGWIPEDQDFRRRTAQFEILAQDGFTCSSPVCTARRDLTVHHITFRSACGSDDPENLVTLCAACHLHGIHERGSIRVHRTASGSLAWVIGGIRYEGGRRVTDAGLDADA